MAEQSQDHKFLDFVVRNLVDHPDDVKIVRKVDEMGVLLTLTVNPEDMGQVIGRSGNTARALRALLRIMGMKSHARVNLKIEEPEGGRREQAPAAKEPAPAADDSAPEKSEPVAADPSEDLEDLEL